MPLPILQAGREASRDDLVRLFHRTELHWTRHVAEEAALDVGTAFSNPELSNIWYANRVLDAALPPGTSVVADAMEEVKQHYQGRGARCWQFVTNPAAPSSQTAPLVEHLVATGWTPDVCDILYLTAVGSTPVRETEGLTIIPARASFRHARALEEEAARAWDEPQLVEASLMHLDDPHWDSLLALEGGEAVGTLGVLAVGEVGRIDKVYVAEAHRRRGIGRTLMGRALEICARSLFKHVMLDVKADNEPAQALYRALGFRKIGQMVKYRAPR